ncbi:MAG: Tripartite DNA replication factor [Caeruleum heppii]|nr:MAG: Tripartite DNA replication factor [Caeruleum heppii]
MQQQAESDLPEVSTAPATEPGTKQHPSNHPQTPAGRLPLAELIANSENPITRRVGKDLSPEERVYWKPSRSPTSSGQSSYARTPGHNAARGQKRARSSSPARSPHGVSTSPKHPEIDLQAVQTLLKTPQDDPAAKLWNRFAGDRDRSNPKDKLPVSVIARFLDASSPRSPVSGSGSGTGLGLRRSASCGIEWPASKTKRRKLSTLHVEGFDDVAPPKWHGQPTSPGKNKISRVSLLVERVQQSLSKPPFDRDPQATDTSPLPRRIAHSTSCPEALIVEEERAQTQPDSEHIEETRMTVPTLLEQRKDPSDGSSDFGDFDPEAIDVDILEAKEAKEATGGPSLDAAVGLAIEKPIETDSVMPDQCLLAVTVPTPALDDPRVLLEEHADLETVLTVEAGEEDEFGEDDDIYAADLEEVVSRYDAQKVTGSSPPSTDYGELLDPPSDVIDGSSRVQPAQEEATVSDDEFGDMADDDLELAAAGIDALEASSGPSVDITSSKPSLPAINRYLITSVAEGHYETPQGQSRPEKVILVQDEKTRMGKAIILRQSWFDSPCTTGAYVHLIGSYTPGGQCIVDDAQHMLILHPDHLISSTVVADAFECTRRAVLQDRVKATNAANPPQVYGHILHEIFQEAMKANRWDSEWLSQLIESVVARYLESIYEIKLEINQAVEYLKSKMPELQAWAELFVSAKPKPNASVKDRNGGSALMSINKLLDVEEHVWSPMYGLKGNIDATVQITLDDKDGRKTLTVPFEVKTGKNTTNAGHRAQTALYTLLLSDRYDIEVAYGILYYMEISDMSRIPAIRHEIRHMVMKRNELACYVRDRLELPPMLKNPHQCGRCYAKTPCFIYHKLVDEGTGETSAMKEKFDEAVKHLKPIHQTFFKHWDNLLTKEETDMLKFRRELWTMLSSEREKLGRCFGRVIIEPGSAYEAPDAPKINRFRYTFVKQRPPAGFSFTNSQIVVGEPIVVSDEKGHFALANGYVTNVRDRRITVAVDRRLHNARTRRKGFDNKDNQTFAGIMEVTEGSPLPTATEDADQEVVYRLDKDEFSNGMATVRNNLIQAMVEGPFGAREIRSRVVELKAPVFKPAPTAYEVPNASDQEPPNEDQIKAIDKVMAAKDYALVLGMPGTGKTTTIAHIIRALISQGKSVLLTSYTHTAVDNILLKLRQDQIPVLRLGAVAKVHPEVQQFVTLAGTPKTSIEELQEAYHGPKVVATTCLGINHPIFNERIFDYCIVDEASQITLPVCLGPIRMAKTFVLVGDHNQLPPLVQNEEARTGGLDISLFKLLSDTHPDSVVNLEHQYRMCEEIMTLSNTLIYNGLLKCGTEGVAKRSLTIPHMEGLKQLHFDSFPRNPSAASDICLRPSLGTCWLRDVLEPSVKACFLNTDPLLPSSREQASGSRTINPTEAGLCGQLVSALIKTGVAGREIGVISVYRSQLAVLRHSIGRHTEVEMHTTDKFQGRDKEVVLVSLVRSNDHGNVGDLLKDWRRINVAFTRARSKLLMVGSRSTLESNPLLRTFLELMEKRGWIYEVPKAAMSCHRFEETQTQMTASQTGAQQTTSSPSPRKDKQSLGVLSPGKENVVPSLTPAACRQTSRGLLSSPGSPSAGVSIKTRIPKTTKPAKTSPKKGTMTERTMLGGRPVLRDILNDLS